MPIRFGSKSEVDAPADHYTKVKTRFEDISHRKVNVKFIKGMSNFQLYIDSGAGILMDNMIEALSYAEKHGYNGHVWAEGNLIVIHLFEAGT